ncbi:MAG: response regulator [Planctomycetota bacterium]
MPTHSFRALVVDDDLIVRRTVASALEQEFFHCELAADGENALAKMARAPFDLVVTDLRLPRKHGYALVCELLDRRTVPVIVVHTDVDNPLLIKELMVRGVDDIVFKPTNYASFAAKIKGLTVRHQFEKARGRTSPASSANPHQPPIPPGTTPLDRGRLLALVDDLQIEEDDLDQVADLPRKSPVAIDVLMMICTNTADVKSIAQMIQSDPLLTDKLIRLANSLPYNASQRKITTLLDAVTRIGTNRICEVITDHLSTLTANVAGRK